MQQEFQVYGPSTILKIIKTIKEQLKSYVYPVGQDPYYTFYHI